jgi:hypothetical protein
MAVAARRIHVSMAAGGLFLAASLAGIPTAGADPTVRLPAMTSTGGGPIKLVSFKSPNVQEVDGSGAAQFITAAATFSNRDLATAFVSLQRVLGCQTDKAGFGARTYRRNAGSGAARCWSSPRALPKTSTR